MHDPIPELDLLWNLVGLVLLIPILLELLTRYVERRISAEDIADTSAQNARNRPLWPTVCVIVVIIGVSPLIRGVETPDPLSRFFTLWSTHPLPYALVAAVISLLLGRMLSTKDPEREPPHQTFPDGTAPQEVNQVIEQLDRFSCLCREARADLKRRVVDTSVDKIADPRTVIGGEFGTLLEGLKNATRTITELQREFQNSSAP